jgi:hypothetical protein
MKKVKMALMGLAAISSIGGAFAFSPKAKKNATTYYAVKTVSGFHWQTNPPDPNQLSCQSTNNAGICSIVTSTAPTDNVIPAGHSSDKMLYQPL